MSAVETRQMSAAGTPLVSTVEVSEKGSGHGPEMVQNGRQVLRIGPYESYVCSGALGTGLPHSMFFLVFG